MAYSNNINTSIKKPKKKRSKTWWIAAALSLIGILLGVGFIFAEAKYQNYPACESSYILIDNNEKIPLANVTLECVEKKELADMKTGIFENAYILGGILVGISIIAFIFLLYTTKHDI